MNINEVIAGWEDRPPKGSPDQGLVVYEITQSITLGKRLRQTWGKWLCSVGQHETKRLWRADKFAFNDLRPWCCCRCKAIMVWTGAEPPFSLKDARTPSDNDKAAWEEAHTAALAVAGEAFKQWQERPRCGYSYQGFGPCTRDPNHKGNHGHEVEPGLVFAPFTGGVGSDPPR